MAWTTINSAGEIKGVGTPGADGADGSFTLTAEQATTSGTAFDFTGIPAGVKTIVVMLDGASTNGTSRYALQIGDAGGLEVTGYTGYSSFIPTATSPTTGVNNGASFEFQPDGGVAAGASHTAVMTLVLQDATNNVWLAHSVLSDTAGTVTATQVTQGRKALSATLTQLRFTTLAGDTFDAGAISIMYK